MQIFKPSKHMEQPTCFRGKRGCPKLNTELWVWQEMTEAMQS